MTNFLLESVRRTAAMGWRGRWTPPFAGKRKVYVSYLSGLAVAAGAPNATSGIDDSYRYKLEEGRQAKVCLHMADVYNENFRRPWDFTDLPIKTPPFPRLSGVDYDERQALALRFSAFPTSPEFDAVQWREGRITRDSKKGRTSPMLVAEADIDNDGTLDVLVKTFFMRGFGPGSRSAPGGSDALFFLDKGQLDLAQSVTLNDFYGQTGKKRPTLVHYGTLGISARSIRPFIYDGITYLSVYEQDRTHEPMRETMWVLRYLDGGGKVDRGWLPVQTQRVCRFRMIVAQ